MKPIVAKQMICPVVYPIHREEITKVILRLSSILESPTLGSVLPI